MSHLTHVTAHNVVCNRAEITLIQGWHHNFKSGEGVKILLQAKRAEKFWGLYPPYMTFLELQQLQRDIWRAYWTVLPRNMPLTIYLAGHAFIGL